MPMYRLICLIAFLAVSLLSNSAHADSFVYGVANHFSGFQVDGTTTTDTNVGVLSYNDITDFNLLITAGGASDILTYSNADNSGLYGYGVTATSTGLFFDYDQSFSLLFFNNTATGTYLCFQTDGCDGFSGPRQSVQVAAGSVFAESQSGNVQIAAIVPPAITPEPSSLMLLGTGAIAAIGVARRRQPIH